MIGPVGLYYTMSTRYFSDSVRAFAVATPTTPHRQELQQGLLKGEDLVTMETMALCTHVHTAM